jgi:cobyrinic acid a,c-diamide synthase
MQIPRILLAAGASGSGKTLITCGILQALVERGLSVASFKCGPDYIDPMFHSRVIGTKSRNLDTFFTSRERTRYLLARNAEGCDIAVMEGVMGYYDGVAGTTVRASAYDLADATDTPVLLIVNSKGMSVSLAAYVKGFLSYKENSHIQGVILNQMSPMLYPRMKKLLEEELGIGVYGYVPKVDDCQIESRHLGLVLPGEIPELHERLTKLAGILTDTLDLEGILKLAHGAPELLASDCITQDSSKSAPSGLHAACGSERDPIQPLVGEDAAFGYRTEKPVRIGVADDEAFCFFYEDNFRLLKEMGAELVHFSPMRDSALPDDLDGLLLYGGYPELHGEILEANASMKASIRAAIEGGMPCMAECGGFMYLHEEMEDQDGCLRKMAGVIPGKAFRTGKLTRFGYITLKTKEDHSIFGESSFGEIPAHEFHYFDSTNNGASFHASKPESRRGWDCTHGTGRLLAGFPHLYYYGNPRVPAAFLKTCLVYQAERGQTTAVMR